MHPEAYAQMDTLLDKWQGEARVLDVGSLDVNGSFRPLADRRGWRYTGIDLTPGPNVSLVALDPYRYPFADATFDIVFSGSTMEHVTQIWRWVPELARLLKPGGLLALLTHTQWEYHPYPVDCWRIMPDGMRALFDLTGQLERYEIEMYNATDISGVAWKKY